MIHSTLTKENYPSPETLRQSTRFGTRDVLTATLLSSFAFASQPAIGWPASVSLSCMALALVMGQGAFAMIGAIAALLTACNEPGAFIAATICLAVMWVIVIIPLALHRLTKGNKSHQASDYG